MKSNIKIFRREVSPLRLLLVFGLTVTIGTRLNLLRAAPTGGQVVQGTASISQVGSTTMITAGNNAIINYQSFNILANETVQFVQPNANSRVLNRVLGDVPTSIFGTLMANGHVYIVNPAGIYFENGSHINVGSLVAAGGNLSDQDFISGKDHFTGVNGNVVNDGTITTASITLAGQQVINNGEINSPSGFVAMLAGDDILVGKRGDHVFVNLGSANSPNTTGVNNSGSINAGGGQTLLAAGDLYSMAVVSSGTINANQIKLEGTGSGIVQASGTLNASSPCPGGVGGEVVVVGQDVALNGATIDASGDAGGGTVLIGGDLHGANPNVINSQATFVSSDSVIHADALGQGNGGEVVVWSDGATRDYGTITARGGSVGGNGGLVETSGKTYLDVTQAPDVSAPHGKGGTWLLDPSDITITNGSNGNMDTQNSPIFTATSDYSVLDVSVIKMALNNNQNVVISTANPNGGTQPGNITVDFNSTIEKTSLGTASLTLSANNNININSAIDSTGGPLNVTLTSLGSAGNVSLAAPVDTQGGKFQISAGTTYFFAAGVTTAGQDITINSSVHVDEVPVLLDTGAASGNIHITGTINGSQSLDLNAPAGDVTLDENVGNNINPFGSLAITGKNVYLHDVFTSGDQIYKASGLLSLGNNYTASRGVINFNAKLTANNAAPASIVKTSPGNLTIEAGSSFAMGQNQKLVVTDGNLNISASTATLGDLGASGVITVTAPTISLLDRLPAPGVPGDNGLDYVAQAVYFNGTTGYGTTGYGGTVNKKVTVASQNGNVKITQLAGLTEVKLPQPFIFTGANGAILDPVARLPEPQMSAVLGLVAAAPQEESAEVTLEDFIGLAYLEDLKNLGIYARPATREELVRLLHGEGLYVQQIVHERPNPEEYQVVDRRMSQAAVKAALKTFHEILPTGQPPQAAEQLKIKLKQSVNDAYASYLDKTKHTEDDPSGFLAYLEAASKNGDSNARGALANLQAFSKLFGQIDELGLTRTEVENSRHYLLHLIEIPSVRPSDLEKIIAPPISSNPVTRRAVASAGS